MVNRTFGGLVAVTLASMLSACSSSHGSNGSGGRSGTGGNSGSGGSSVNCGSDNPDDLISEFKTDNGIHPADGRSGGWYLYPDHPGTFTPPITSPYPVDTSTGNSSCSGPGSLHVKATGFGGTPDSFGAAMAVDFVPQAISDAGNAVKGTYDGTKYTGISFWAKASDKVKLLQVKFIDAYTDAQGDPGAFDSSAFPCALVPNFPNNCSPYIVKFSQGDMDTNYPKYDNTAVDTDWKMFSVYFADAKQDMFNQGQMSPGNKLDAKHLLGFAIQINADFSMKPPIANDFEIWLDDVRFIR